MIATNATCLCEISVTQHRLFNFCTMVILIAINSISTIVVKNCINIIFTVFGTLQAIFIIYCIYKVGFK